MTSPWEPEVALPSPADPLSHSFDGVLSQPAVVPSSGRLSAAQVPTDAFVVPDDEWEYVDPSQYSNPYTERPVYGSGPDALQQTLAPPTNLPPPNLPPPTLPPPSPAAPGVAPPPLQFNGNGHGVPGAAGAVGTVGDPTLDPRYQPEAGELKIKERRSWRTWQLVVIALVAAMLGMWFNGATGGTTESANSATGGRGGYKLPTQRILHHGGAGGRQLEPFDHGGRQFHLDHGRRRGVDGYDRSGRCDDTDVRGRCRSGLRSRAYHPADRQLDEPRLHHRRGDVEHRLGVPVRAGAIIAPDLRHLRRDQRSSARIHSGRDVVSGVRASCDTADLYRKPTGHRPDHRRLPVGREGDRLEFVGWISDLTSARQASGTEFCCFSCLSDASSSSK